ncbi:hypothetical protein DFH29DRAFT_1072322 [Suillus ampliporus]|nr:hypothetical protein DFH29DRAFT_1072322 [Suillus ampliporus]
MHVLRCLECSVLSVMPWSSSDNVVGDWSVMKWLSSDGIVAYSAVVALLLGAEVKWRTSVKMVIREGIKTCDANEDVAVVAGMAAGSEAVTASTLGGSGDPGGVGWCPVGTELSPTSAIPATQLSIRAALSSRIRSYTWFSDEHVRTFCCMPDLSLSGGTSDIEGGRIQEETVHSSPDDSMSLVCKASSEKASSSGARRVISEVIDRRLQLEAKVGKSLLIKGIDSNTNDEDGWDGKKDCKDGKAGTGSAFIGYCQRCGRATTQSGGSMIGSVAAGERHIASVAEKPLSGFVGDQKEGDR